MTIHELARQPGCRTDKQDLDHTFQGQNYLHVYERYFEQIRETVSSVLEIGVLNGDSLRLWRDYFPHAHIWGLDINPDTAAHTGHRIDVVIGNQSDPPQALLDAGGFDIIIDDGSHIVSRTLDSCRVLWPLVRHGGFYAIEDLGITYFSNWLAQPHVARFNSGSTRVSHNRQDLDQMLTRTMEGMDRLTGTVRALYYHSRLVVIEHL